MIVGVKLEQEELVGQRVTSVGEGWIEVNGKRHAGALLLSNETVSKLDNSATLDSLAGSKCVQDVIAQGPAVVLIGTGSSFAPASPKLTAQFNEAGIGLDAMDTGAACRTFNVLAGEERQVVAILFH